MSDLYRSLIESFVWKQSYGKTFGGSIESISTAENADSPGHRWHLPLDLTAAIAQVAWPVDWTMCGATQEASWSDVQALLYNALGLLRREPSNPYNDHRAFPSPRCLYATHAYLLYPEAGRALHYSPTEHALEEIDGADRKPESPEKSWTADTGGVIAIISRYTRIPEYYRDLRYTLAILEAGHSLYNVALVAAALRIRARICLAFDDAAVLRRLELSAHRGWTPIALVTLGKMAVDSGTLRLGELDDSSHGRKEATHPLRAGDSSANDFLAAVDAAGWLAETGCDAWRRRGVVPPSAPDGTIAASAPPSAPLNDLAAVLFRRNSGRGNHGLSGAMKTISPQVVSSACREGFRPIPSDLAQAAWTRTGLRVLLVVERVESLEDGLYELFPAESALAMVRRGRWLADVQRAFSPPVGIYISSFNVVWFLVVDYGQVLNELGPRGFRLVNIELGWIAQGVSCAMAAEGLFARPCRSYSEPLLDTILGLSAREQVGYEVLCGVNRFHDVVLDLRC